MSLSPSVRAGFLAWTERFEGYVAWPYLDVRGLVTISYGCLIDPLVAEVSALDWRIGGEPASAAEIRSEWEQVKGMRPGMPARDYAGALTLSRQSCEKLALTRLDADVVQLERTFGDLSALPEQAQTALCSMAWALGVGFPATWPRFTAAIIAGDWSNAAAESSISTVGNPGVAARNVAVRALLASLAAA